MLLTRPPLRLKIFVRLACVKHTASVHPDPGSSYLNDAFHFSAYPRSSFDLPLDPLSQRPHVAVHPSPRPSPRGRCHPFPVPHIPSHTTHTTHIRTHNLENLPHIKFTHAPPFRLARALQTNQLPALRRLVLREVGAGPQALQRLLAAVQVRLYDMGEPAWITHTALSHPLSLCLLAAVQVPCAPSKPVCPLSSSPSKPICPLSSSPLYSPPSNLLFEPPRRYH